MARNSIFKPLKTNDFRTFASFAPYGGKASSETRRLNPGGRAMKKQEYFDATFPDGERVIIDVTGLNAALTRMHAPTVSANVTPALVKQVSENGIEPEHLERLKAGDPDFTPATMIEWRNLTYVVDGNHRASLWIAAGSPRIPARIATETLWRLFVVERPNKESTHAQLV